jgi:hypothetical protein
MMISSRLVKRRLRPARVNLHRHPDHDLHPGAVAPA